MPTARSVLFAASECAGLVKTGGLGDVVAALPAALRARGVDARVVLPRFDVISTKGLTRLPGALGVPLGGQEEWCAVYQGKLAGTEVPVYFLEHHGFFGRGYLYDPPAGHAPDNLRRFSFLSRGALQLCKLLGWAPDVLHVHDWPTALAPIYLNAFERSGPLARTASVLTLHNLSHQTKFGAAQFPTTGLPPGELRADSLEDHGSVNPLKGGLYHSNLITAVSPRYAREIRTPEGGAGLDPVVRFRGRDLVGILNGIDDVIWDPATDPLLPARFSAQDLSGKAICKRELQQEFGLDVRADVPLLAVVSRLTEQKGTDVILAALDRLLGFGTQVVVLGSGGPGAEGYLATRSQSGNGNFRAWIGFSERMAHRIEAAADLFLMPSRFEPCGLNQLYSQRYGTLPVVRATGGLDDTVDNYDAAAGTGTGFKMQLLSEDALVGTVAWAVDTYRNHPEAFRAMQLRAMAKEFGWGPAAEAYQQAYGWAMERVVGR
jgi:starch synthase